MQKTFAISLWPLMCVPVSTGCAEISKLSVPIIMIAVDYKSNESSAGSTIVHQSLHHCSPDLTSHSDTSVHVCGMTTYDSETQHALSSS